MECDKCNSNDALVKVYTKLCKECENEFMKEYLEEQDKIREEYLESIKRDSY